MSLPYKKTFWNVDTDVQLHIGIPQIVKDTLNPNTVHIIANNEVYNTRFLINNPANVRSLYINDQEIFVERETDRSMTIEAFAMLADTLSLRIVKIDDSKKQAIGINSNFRSLPIEDELPINALRTDGYTGIVQQVEM